MDSSVLCSSHFASSPAAAIAASDSIIPPPPSLAPPLAHLLLQLSGWSYYSVWKLAPAAGLPLGSRIVWCHGGVNPTVDDYHGLALILEHYQRRGFLPLPQSRLASLAIQSRRAQWPNSAGELLFECAAASIKALVYVPVHEGEVLELGTTETIGEKEKEATVAHIRELIGVAASNGGGAPPPPPPPQNSFVRDDASNEVGGSSMGKSSAMTHQHHNNVSSHGFPNLDDANFGLPVPPEAIPPPPLPTTFYTHLPNYNDNSIANDLLLQDHTPRSPFHDAILPPFDPSPDNLDPFPVVVDNLPSLVDLSRSFSEQIHVAPSYDDPWTLNPSCQTTTNTAQVHLPQYPLSRPRDGTSSHSLMASSESGTYSTHYRSAFQGWAPLCFGAHVHHQAPTQCHPSLLKICLVSWLPKLAKSRPVQMDLCCETSRTKSSSTSTYSNVECNNHATTSMQSNDAATQHMIAERRRRKRQRDHFTALKSLVPTIKKRDKVTILEHSLQYIQQLQDRVRELEQEQDAKMQKKHCHNHIERDGSNHVTPTSNANNDSGFVFPTQNSNSSVALYSLGPPSVFALTMAIEKKVEDTSNVIVELIHCLRMKGLDCIHLEFTTNPNPIFKILARKREKVNATLTSNPLLEIEECWKKLALNYK